MSIQFESIVLGLLILTFTAGNGLISNMANTDPESAIEISMVGLPNITISPDNSITQHSASKEIKIANIKKPGSKGTMKIAKLVEDPKKYEGKTVQIKGECVKVNSGILGRNWIHLKDGSKDDFDLVITSMQDVSVGQVVKMKGTVVLDKDFGAGYFYNIIIENGEIVR